MRNRPFIFLHFSDLHARRDNLDKVEKALDAVICETEQRSPDAVFFSGDLWDGEVSNIESSPLILVVDKIRELSRMATVFILHGTPGHDRPGSLEIFKRLESSSNNQNSYYPNKPIIVLDRPEPYLSGNLVILPIPAVTKSGLIQKAHDQGQSISPEQTDEACAQLLNEMILLYKINLAEQRKQNPDTIGVVLGHITVTGSETSTGQTILGGDVCLPVSTLAEVGAEYVGLGHIHKPQEFEPNIFYAGSTFPVNWGEVEEKSFIYGEISPGELKIERIPFPFPAMVDLTAVVEDGLILEYEGHDCPKTNEIVDPKSIDQPRFTKSGKTTQNGLFAKSVDEYKTGDRKPEIVRVYEKLFSGIWSEKGFFKLLDYRYVKDENNRKVFMFILESTAIDFNSGMIEENALRPRSRVIPSEVKKEVWLRDGGQCVLCGATDELHFDHDLPYSKGGSSITADNVRILCARHNLSKSNKIE